MFDKIPLNNTCRLGFHVYSYLIYHAWVAVFLILPTRRRHLPGNVSSPLECLATWLFQSHYQPDLSFYKNIFAW
jgi:hypothetical protein